MSRRIEMVAVALSLVACRPQAPEEETGSSGETASEETTTTGPGASDPTMPTGPGASDPTMPTAPGSETGPEEAQFGPQEAPWATVVDRLPFPAEIGTLTVGRLEYNGNFANRGDVEVRFDQDAQVISVEMRVYDFSDKVAFFGSEGVEGTLERFALWAYASSEDPRKPSEMAPEDDCTVGAWKEGCKIYAYYDGQVAPIRSGADLRVHLPKNYRGRLEVVTEDNLAEVAYPRPGDVVIDGLCGSGEVSLAQGVAQVRLCRELTPTPTCAPELVAQCESFTVDGVPAAWSPQCPCPPDLFGQLAIETRAPFAGDITIDVPDTTWMNVHVTNKESQLPHACTPEIDDCGGDGCVLISEMYAASAEYNYPSPAAPAGAGYNVTAVAAGCGPVNFFASIDDWVDEDSPPMTAERGHIRVCTGCL